MKDRTEYQKQYYQKHKEEIKKNYNAQTQYVKWTDLKKMLNHSRKEVGENNFLYLLEEAGRLQRYKG